jgi:flagellin
MRLSHNLASLNIYKEQNKVLQKQGTALERISTGSKVNRTRDNPDALGQSERLRMQIRGAQMACRNVQDGMSMLQTAEGGLGSINEMLQRARELAVQAGSGSNSTEDIAIIKTELDELLKGMDDTAKNTEFNGVKLLSEDGFKMMATGANVGEEVAIPLKDVTSSKLFPGGIDITNSNGVNTTIQAIDSAIKTTTDILSQYGALENRFESTYNNLNELSDKMTGADSSIRDADIAQEMMEFAKSNILIEAGTAMMAQSNKFPQDILRILENIRR